MNGRDDRSAQKKVARQVARFSFFLALSSSLWAAPTQVSVSGRRLLVSGNAFTVVGVNYSPTPVGKTVQGTSPNCDGGYQWWTDRPTYLADFPLIQRMGANTIRTFSLMNSAGQTAQVLQVLDQAQADNLHVIMGYFVQSYPAYDLSNAANQAQIQAELIASVNAYKNHPAVLMWMIGNEQNLNNGNSTVWYNLLNTLAGQVKAADPNHPVGTVEGECPQGGCSTTQFNVGNAAVQADDGHMPNLDIWGVTAYRGKTFQGLFQTLLANTAKPVLVAEFGRDAYHDSLGREDQDMQASYVVPQWQEIAAHLSAVAPSNILIGGAVFEWTDEWWQDGVADCLTHGTHVSFTRSDDTVDPAYQNAWFGIASVSPVNAISNPAGTARTLRASYTALQNLWSPAAASAASGSSGLFQGTVHNYPNPFRVGSGDTKFVALTNVAAKVDVKIYDAGGQFVASLTQSSTGPGRAELFWDGRNSQGAFVSPGLYVARIEGTGSGMEEKQFRRVVAVK